MLTCCCQVVCWSEPSVWPGWLRIIAQSSVLAWFHACSVKGKSDFALCKFKLLVPPKNILSLYPCLLIVVLSVMTYLLFLFPDFYRRTNKVPVLKFLLVYLKFLLWYWDLRWPVSYSLALTNSIGSVENRNESNCVMTVGHKYLTILKMCNFPTYICQYKIYTSGRCLSDMLFLDRCWYNDVGKFQSALDF